MFTETNSFSKPLRDQIGEIHFMSQLERSYPFPVKVYRESEDGSRALVRVEVPDA